MTGVSFFLFSIMDKYTPYTIKLKYQSVVFARDRWQAYDRFCEELRGAPGSYIVSIDAGSESKKKVSLWKRLLFGY